MQLASLEPLRLTIMTTSTKMTIKMTIKMTTSNSTDKVHNVLCGGLSHGMSKATRRIRHQCLRYASLSMVMAASPGYTNMPIKGHLNKPNHASFLPLFPVPRNKTFDHSEAHLQGA
jgi:hypothetical protein